MEGRLTLLIRFINTRTRRYKFFNYMNIPFLNKCMENCTTGCLLALSIDIFWIFINQIIKVIFLTRTS